MKKTERMRPRSIGLVLLAALWGMPPLLAQESANTAGGDATGSGGSVAYSIGQVVYTTETGSGGSLAQGVQQPYEVITVGVAQPGATVALTAFPNPATDQITLSMVNGSADGLSYQLFDLNGKLLQQAPIAASQIQLDMRHLAMATYFLKVTNEDNQPIQSFKIIKN